jgi:hypothetical protein
MLCNAGNVSIGCSEMLFATIQWPEIMEADAHRVNLAKNNLRSRFNISWAEIEAQERETRRI